MKRLGVLLISLVLVAVCLVLLPTEAKAASESDLTFTLNSNGRSYSVTDCNESASGSLVIPATYNGKSVTSIGDYAFRYCDSLTSITIPDSVTSIGNNAFQYCDRLTSVTIPDTVTILGDYAFYSCDRLTSVTIGSRVTSIGSYAFGYCDSLTSVTIGSRVTSIGDYAFYSCDKLTSVTIPDTVTSIGDYAFYYCLTLTSITIPDSVTSIGYYAFYYCKALTSITIPDSVTSIGAKAFGSCRSLTSVTIGNSVTSIGDATFECCYKLTDVTIGKGVTSIGSNAFDCCTSLAGITIPDSVTSIGSQAFYNCTGLAYVIIGNSVTSIDSQTFYKCTSLVSITIGNRVGCIDPQAFFDCDSLTSVNIPNSVTSISNYAFASCDNLISVTIPDSVTSIGISAFEDCTRLNYYIYDNGKYLGNRNSPYLAFIETTSDSIESCQIFEGTKIIADLAFANCDSLTSITIPDSVTIIGDGAFHTCTSLTSATIGNGVTSISNSAFSSCTSLTSITFGNNVTSIVGYAFKDCESLVSIIIGNRVRSIGVQAFYNCSSLTSVTIPDSVTSIDDFAFGGCSSLTSVIYCGTQTRWNFIDIGGVNSNLTDAELQFHSPDAATTCTEDQTCTVCGEVLVEALGHTWVDATCTAPKTCSICGETEGETLGHIWIDATYTAPKTCSVCGETEGEPLLIFTLNADGQSYSVTDCDTSASGELVIPDTYNGKPVTSIGDYAFENCESLTSITIPNGITSIGDYALEYCYNLTTITIPDSVTSIGDFAFAYCIRLASVTIPNCVTSIGESAFYYCLSLTSIAIPESLSTISSEMFRECTRLTNVNIPDSVTSIGVGAFYLCERLTNVTIPDSVTSIGSWAFRGCYSLTSVTIPDSVTSIDYGAFEHCESLTSVTIPDSVTNIGSSAFEYCDSLTSVTIPDSVTSIGSWAFRGCCSLTSVTIPDSITGIGIGTFYQCTSLTSVTIPNSVTSIGNAAFNGCSNLADVIYCGTNSQWNSITIGSSNTELTNARRQYHTVHTPGAAATCTEDQVCTVCGEVLTEKLGHNYKTTTVAPQVGVEGYDLHTCTRCGDSYKDNYTDALPETPDEPFMLPTAELVNGKIVVSGTYDYIRLVYVGEENNVFDSWANMKKAGLRYTVVNGTEGFRLVEKDQMPVALPKYGNYAVRVMYTNTDGVAAGINYPITYKLEIPGVELVDNKVIVSGTYTSIRVVYVADKNNVFATWGEMKTAGAKCPDVNTDAGYIEYATGEEVALPKYGNYAVRVMYTNDKGAAAGVNYPIEYKGAAVVIPTVELVENRIVVSGDYTSIRVVYLANKSNDLATWGEMKEAGAKYPEVNTSEGYREYNAGEDVILPRYGNYAVRVMYINEMNTTTGVNYPIEYVGAAVEIPTVELIDNQIVVTGAYDTIRVVYLSNKNNVFATWGEMQKAGKKYPTENTAEGFIAYGAGEEVVLPKYGRYAVRVIYTNEKGVAAGVNYPVDYMAPEVPAPTVELVGGKLTVNGVYDSVRVVYVGDGNNNFTTWAAMLKAGKKYTAENTLDGHRVYSSGQQVTLAKAGNYAVRVLYNDAYGVLVGANYAFTLDPEDALVPTAKLVDGKIQVIGEYEYIRVVYVGSKNNIFATWAEMKKAGLEYTAVNGKDGHIVYEKDQMPAALTKSGNYAVRVLYKDENGNLAGVNYAFTYKP